MSTTLNLADRILDTACNLHHLGRSHDAAQLLNRLASWRDLPRDCAEEAHVRLAEIHLEFEQPKQARRHLAIALALEPECAHYYYLMAVALEDDPKCDPRRADAPYRRCLALDPDHAEYQCDYGVYAVQQGRTRAGLAALRRAAALALDDPDMLGRVAAGMRRADRADEAKELLRAALFRNPHDQRFRNLWSKHQFDLLHAAQQEPSQRWTTAADAPTILPFRKPKKRTQEVGGKTIRTDGPSELKGPSILPLHVPRKKNA